MERYRVSQRPPRLPRPPVMPSGPSLYRATKKASRHYGGPGDPPVDFVGATSSAVEWIAYWAIWRAVGAPGDPRVPPYVGSPGLFSYQDPFEGGRTGPGGQVIDFVVFQGPKSRDNLAIRIQTDYWHYRANAAKQALDAVLKGRIASNLQVADVYDYELVGDPTGQKAVIAIKRVLAGERSADPLVGGTVQRVQA